MTERKKTLTILAIKQSFLKELKKKSFPPLVSFWFEKVAAAAAVTECQSSRCHWIQKEKKQHKNLWIFKQSLAMISFSFFISLRKTIKVQRNKRRQTTDENCFILILKSVHLIFMMASFKLLKRGI